MKPLVTLILFYISTFIPLASIQYYLISLGASPTFVGKVLAVSSIISAIASLIFSKYSDVYGRKKTTLFSFFLLTSEDIILISVGYILFFVFPIIYFIITLKASQKRRGKNTFPITEFSLESFIKSPEILRNKLTI